MFAFIGILSTVGLIVFTHQYFKRKEGNLPAQIHLILCAASGLLTVVFTFLDPHRILALLLLLSGCVGGAVSLILLIIKAAKKVPTKKVSIVLLASFLVFVLAITGIVTGEIAPPEDPAGDVVQGPDNQPPYVPDQTSDPGQVNEPVDPGSGGDIPDNPEPTDDGETPDTEEPQSPDQSGHEPDEEPGDTEQPIEEPSQPTEPAGEDPEEEPEETLSGSVKVHYIDVGQGDAILIQAPDKTVLIDGGPRSAGTTVVNYLLKQDVSTIDLVISTHPHEDHIGGLINVLTSFTVGEVIDPGIDHTSKTFESYIDMIDAANIPFTEAKPGISRDLGGTAQLQIIGPRSPSSSDLNNSSVVARLTFGDVSFLFTGDAESQAETQLLNSDYALTSDVLKVGHHGSETSTSQAFLNKVRPAYAVISCGDGNSYEHPRQVTLDKLKAANINTYRTDTHGNITITTDGDRVTVKAAKSPSSTVVFTGADTGTEDPGEDESGDDEEEPPATDPGDGEGKYVGSKESDKYHYPSCRYAEKILPENQIWFADAQEAIAAGYSPCGVCDPPSQ